MPGLPGLYDPHAAKLPHPRDQPNGAEPKRTWRRSQIHAKSSQ